MGHHDAATRGPDEVRDRYLAERDRRLVPGRSELRDLSREGLTTRYRNDPFTPRADRAPVVEELDVVVVGGGIAGILVATELRRAGVNRFRIVDQAGGVGGTWYWNRYPGVMCDVESYIYLPLLEELGYVPRDRYASGEEILGHLQAVADHFDLCADALFHTGVSSATWDEQSGRWQVTTDRGDQLSTRYYVLAVGILNLLKLPAIAGMDDFGGHSFHSSRWDYGYTGGGPGQPLTQLSDKAVALVGTGATGIQCVRPLADSARELLVVQRTPSAIGERGNRPTDPDFTARLRPGWQRERMDNFQSVMLGRQVDDDLVDDGWTRDYAAVQNPGRKRDDETFADYLQRAEAVDLVVMEAHRDRVATTVHDPTTAEILKPWYRYLCKRPCFHDEYLEAFNLPNVRLVDCPAGIDRVTETGLVVDGNLYEVDCIVWATGFEAELTPLYRRAGHDVVGTGGRSLAEEWGDGAHSLFGMMVRGFPNLFAMPAPGQQAVVTVNYTQLAVLGAEVVGRTIGTLVDRGARVFEVGAAAEQAWTDEVVASFVDASAVMSACTPSRVNNEGRPDLLNPRNGNWGRGFGDYFAYRDRLYAWLDAGDLDGLELR